jgi:predicted amidohydrolase
VRVTLAQVSPRPREVEANLERLVALVSEHAAGGLLVAPELYLSGYELSDVEAVAVDLDGPEMERLRRSAGLANLAVIVGLAEHTAGGVSNSAVCIDASGELVGVYRKTHLFGAESDAYVSGDRLAVFPLGGRSVGLMICFDLEFPEVARTLAAQGADMLVTVSANSPPFELDHDLFARTRALENGLPHVYVNRVGEEDGLTFCGGSLALDPDARVLAEAGAEEERILHADVGPPLRRDPRTRYREQLRSELYANPAQAVREEL